MIFTYSDKVNGLVGDVAAFMDEFVYPKEAERREWNEDSGNRFRVWPELDTLKEKARARGLWNLFLPREYGKFSPGLTNLEYAPIAELMGRVSWASEVFNCSAPDTGNMDLLAKYGSEQQQQEWLEPLLAGEIRSAYLMTEPNVASSDAENLETSIRREGDEYVVHGRKWWITGIMDPRCKVLLVMGKTDPQAARHRQHSILIVPRDRAGVSIIRTLHAFGAPSSLNSEAEISLDGVRVPKECLVQGEGDGFKIAQGRLGPGRIHHCMRAIGQAQRSLELMARRADGRVAQGRKLSEQSSVLHGIARSACEIEQARLLTLKAADLMDRVGNRAAKELIAAIKVVAPSMLQNVVDRAIQIHGGMGVGDDTPLAEFFLISRCLRIADGPDEVHMSQLGKWIVAKYAYDVDPKD